MKSKIIKSTKLKPDTNASLNQEITKLKKIILSQSNKILKLENKNLKVEQKLLKSQMAIKKPHAVRITDFTEEQATKMREFVREMFKNPIHNKPPKK